MILPLSDAPNPRGTPVVNYALIALNLAIYVLITLPLSQRAPDYQSAAFLDYARAIQDTLPRNVPIEYALQGVSAYDVFVFEHGFRPAAASLKDLLFSMFLHGGFMHLFGNMLFLWIYGDNVEYRLGRARYLLYYLLTGAAATLFYSLFARGSKLPLVGASGAISGVLGFYFLWFPRNTVRLFVFLFPFFMNVVQVPARLVLGIYLVLDNLLPFVLSRGSGTGGVAHGAHIGGFLAGLLVAHWMNRQEASAAPEAYRPRAAAGEAPPPLSLTGLVNAGAMEDAARGYFALSAEGSRNALSPAAMLQLGQWLAANGHPEAALTVFRRHLRDHPRGAGRAEAHVGAGLVQLHVLRQVAPAYQHFLDALDAEPLPETAALAQAGLREIAELQKYALHRFRG